MFGGKRSVLSTTPVLSPPTSNLAVRLCVGQGREAMEWVIGKINQEVHELASATKSAVKTTDELLHTAKHSVDGLAEKARQLGHITDGITEKAKNIHLTTGEAATTQRPL